MPSSGCILFPNWFIFSDLPSDAWTFSCLYSKRYIIYGQNSQSQEFQQNNLLKSCIGSLVKFENCNRTASPPELAHCATLSTKGGGHGAKKVIRPIFSPFQTISGRKYILTKKNSPSPPPAPLWHDDRGRYPPSFLGCLSHQDSGNIAHC